LGNRGYYENHPKKKGTDRATRAGNAEGPLGRRREKREFLKTGENKTKREQSGRQERPWRIFLNVEEKGGEERLLVDRLSHASEVREEGGKFKKIWTGQGEKQLSGRSLKVFLGLNKKGSGPQGSAGLPSQVLERPRGGAAELERLSYAQNRGASCGTETKEGKDREKVTSNTCVAKGRKTRLTLVLGRKKKRGKGSSRTIKRPGQFARS